MGDTLSDAAAGLLGRLRTEDLDGLSPAELVDLLAAAERLKGAAAACQARATVQLAALERDAGRGDGVAVQVGLSTRQSPYKARRFVGFAHAPAESTAARCSRVSSIVSFASSSAITAPRDR